MPADSKAKEVPSYLYVVKINDPDFKWAVYRGPFYSREEALKWRENSPYQTKIYSFFIPPGNIPIQYYNNISIMLKTSYSQRSEILHLAFKYTCENCDTK